MRRPFSNPELLARFARSKNIQHWHLVASGAPHKRGRLRVLFLVSALMLGVATAIPSDLPIGVRIAFVLAAIVAIVLAVFGLRPEFRASGAYVAADDTGIARFAPDGEKLLARWDAPFGVALLASYGRQQALLAFTSSEQTRYVPIRIEGRSEPDDELFARISVLADLDLIDGVVNEAALMPESAAAIVRHLEAHDASSLGRVFMSDGRGAPISLDRATLAIGERSFDLTSQLEWRTLMFHESTGQSSALYQATWIRQSSAEVVLVAPMPSSIVPREPNAHREAAGRLGRALTRDLRLLQAPAEPPPAREVRVAIDRPFMMAVRRALDEAPLSLRASIEAPPDVQDGQDGRTATGAHAQRRDSMA